MITTPKSASTAVFVAGNKIDLVRVPVPTTSTTAPLVGDIMASITIDSVSPVMINDPLTINVVPSDGTRVININGYTITVT